LPAGQAYLFCPYLVFDPGGQGPSPKVLNVFPSIIVSSH